MADKNKQLRGLWVVSKLKAIPQGKKILDVAAGTCPYKKYCSHLIYESQDFCQLDSSQMENKQYARHTYVCDVTSIHVPDGTFDVVMCTEGLEHFPEPIKAVCEMSRILKSNGLLLLTAPLGSGIHQRPYHYYGGFTSYWYELFLRKVGFQEISCEPSGGFFTLLSQECERAEVMLRKGVSCNNLRLVIWPFVGIPLRLFIAPLLRFVDKVIPTTDFTIGYHVIARKYNG
jgi:SAM-dependent methyltransferase